MTTDPLSMLVGVDTAIAEHLNCPDTGTHASPDATEGDPLGPLLPGMVHALYGPPGSGSTSYTTSLVTHLALDHATPTAWFSTEGTPRMCVARLLAARTATPLARCLSDIPTARDLAHTPEGELVRHAPLMLWGTSAPTWTAVETALREAANRGCTHVVIDRVTDIDMATAATVLRRVRAIAAEYALIATATLETPEPADEIARMNTPVPDWAGAVDIATSIERPGTDHAFTPVVADTPQPDEVRLSTTKNRYGPTGTLRRTLESSFSRVVPLRMHPQFHSEEHP